MEVCLAAKKKWIPEEETQRTLIRELLEQSNAGSMENNGLEAELEDELGYSKYDYRNKDMDNSRNG